MKGEIGRSVGPVNVELPGDAKSGCIRYMWITVSGEPSVSGEPTPMRISGATVAPTGGGLGPSRSAGSRPSKFGLSSPTKIAVSGWPFSIACRSNAVTVIRKPFPNSRTVM